MKRVVLLLVLALSAWGWHERQALADFPDILSAYSAKEYCSCRFVMGFAEAYCRAMCASTCPWACWKRTAPGVWSPPRA